MLTHILNNRESMRVAVIVNDMAELNIDSKLISSNTELRQTEEKLIEMQNGCICCTLREDLLKEVRELAEQGRFDYLIIESSGISEPMQVAETFSIELEGIASLREVARLDTTVTVVDPANFPTNILADPEDTVTTRWGIKRPVSTNEKYPGDEEAGEADELVGDDRPISQLYIDQIEFADVIVINKVDLASEQEIAELERCISMVNQHARIIKASHGRVDLKEILDTKRFSEERAQTHGEWLKSWKQQPLVPETVEYGISSFVYRKGLPFHPERLDMVLAGRVLHDLKLFRSKGFAWIANVPDVAVVWSSAGRIFNIYPGDAWENEIDVEDLEGPKERLLRALRRQWPARHRAPLLDHPVLRDRRQEIVFIGQHLNQAAISAELDGALVTKEEWQAGPRAWAAFNDPITIHWVDEDEDEDEDDDDDEDYDDDESSESEERQSQYNYSDV